MKIYSLIRNVFLTAFVSASVIPATATAQNPASRPADALIQKLRETRASDKTMFGHHDDPVYGHTWKYEDGRSDVLEATGRYPAVFSWDLGGIENGDSLNLDGVPFSLMRKEIMKQNRRGGVNTFSWHTRNAVNNKDSWTVDDKTIVTQMMKNPEAYRKQLRRLADFFNSLTDENGKKIPVIFRPWHEHTGGWFFWGTPNTSKEEYAFLWKEMRKIFDEKGVDNVVWAYSPDVVKDAAQYMERYPGDEYVDIMGIDVYHRDPNGRAAYLENAGRGLSIVNEMAEKHGKIPAFSETGLERITEPGWYSVTLLPLLKQYKPVYVVVWRDAHDIPTHYYVPQKGEKSMESFRKFVKDPQVVTLPPKGTAANATNE